MFVELTFTQTTNQPNIADFALSWYLFHWYVLCRVYMYIENKISARMCDDDDWRDDVDDAAA